jgi:hypothetical protein
MPRAMAIQMLRISSSVLPRVRRWCHAVGSSTTPIHLSAREVGAAVSLV